MSASHHTGKQGEAIAVEYLTQKGYDVLETNWQSNHQEIDIIARQGDILVIAEVKTRNTNYFGEPETFVTKQKQRMLIKATNHYITKNDLNVTVRFDIISILYNKDEHKLKHIEDAFYPLI